MTVNQKPTEFQKSLATINFQIGELIRGYIDNEQVDQEKYFYRLTELDQNLEMWRNALDEFAIQADDHYSQNEQTCDNCGHSPAHPYKGEHLCDACQDDRHPTFPI